MILLRKKEFYGSEFYAMCQQEYDTARNYLKNCGKPQDDIDRWFINFHKDTVSIFGKLLTEERYV
jgi:hypothetical protein